MYYPVPSSFILYARDVASVKFLSLSASFSHLWSLNDKSGSSVLIAVIVVLSHLQVSARAACS